MQIFGRSVGAALAAGNACVVKPAEDACLSLLRVAELALEAGFPDGALNIVTGFGARGGRGARRAPGHRPHLVHRLAREVGTLVQAAAAQQPHRPCTLELGGKSPQIVFADADLDAAPPVLVSAIIQNAGQTCSAGSRVLVERRVYERVRRRRSPSASRARAPGRRSCDLDLRAADQRRRRSARVEGFLARARGGRHPGAGARARRRRTRRPAATTSRRRCSATCRATHRLACEEVFGPVLGGDAVRRRGRRDRARQRHATTGSSPASGPRDGGRQLRVARARCAAARCSSTTTARAAASSCRSAASSSSGHGREKGFEALYGFSALKTIVLNHG